MVTSSQALEKYGKPNVYMEYKHMEMWIVPQHLRDAIPALPYRIYLNKDLREPLYQALTNVVNRGLAHEIKTWDGCFNVRKKRGGSNAWSLHAFAIAVDINQATNGFRQTPSMSAALVACFTDAGFEWGGYWTTNTDGMHFQLKTI